MSAVSKKPSLEVRALKIKYQACDNLAPDDYVKLQDSIGDNGIMDPIEVTEDGYILDGHNRWKFALEMLIECPMKVVPDSVCGSSDDERLAYAWMRNRARRQMTAEQKRKVWKKILGDGGSVRDAADATGSDENAVYNAISDNKFPIGKDLSPDTHTISLATPTERRREAVDKALTKSPEKSDRQIAKDTGVSQPTVSKRRKKKDNPTPPQKKKDLTAQAQKVADRICAAVDALQQLRNHPDYPEQERKVESTLKYQIQRFIAASAPDADQ